MTRITYITLFLAIFLLPLANADSTFFDNEDDAFIMDESTSGETAGDTVAVEGTNGGGCTEDFEIIIPSEVNLVSGHTRQISITLKNIGSCNLHGINVSLDVPQGWNSDSFVIDDLYGNKNQTVALGVTPPDYASGKYNVTVKADRLREHESKELYVLIYKEESLPKDIPTPIFPRDEFSTTREKPVEIPNFVYVLLTLSIVLTLGWLYYHGARR